MVHIDMAYAGGLLTQLVHPSGVKIVTDAPRDNQGEGSSFSPTDLLAASLASCALTTMAIRARQTDVVLTGAYASIEKHMENNPRRVGRVAIDLHLPAQMLDSKYKMLLEEAALQCPVAQSLHANVLQEIQFIYDVKND
jgi:putative redox protein